MTTNLQIGARLTGDPAVCSTALFCARKGGDERMATKVCQVIALFGALNISAGTAQTNITVAFNRSRGLSHPAHSNTQNTERSDGEAKT
jgi:hypothetical protein